MRLGRESATADRRKRPNRTADGWRVARGTVIIRAQHAESFAAHSPLASVPRRPGFADQRAASDAMLGSAAAWGAGSALSWGVSDFIARFAGRSVGVIAATFALMTISLALLALFVWLAGVPMLWVSDGLGYLIGTGIAAAVATVLLYDALSRGPVSLASPIVASYPVVAVPISVALGERPGAIHWLAMAGTLAGVWLVARAVSAKADGGEAEYAPAVIRRSLLFAIGAALGFGITVTAADRAIEVYGPWQTMLGVRAVGVVVFGLWLLFSRRPTRFPRRSWPVLLGLGLLDTLGYLGVFLGLTLKHGEFAVVASSAYTVVTVLLARIFLREPISALQWSGVILVVGGIAVLAAFG